MKFLRVLCVLALALFVAGSVYAETQSVKVSGDLTMRGIFRDGYDYRGSVDEPNVTRTNVGNRSQQGWFMTNAEIEIDADLTDNVQTVIRLVNQRDWNVKTKTIAQGTTLATNGLGGYDDDISEFNVNLDLAYVVLKDFIYSPLTLTVGRQDLWFGKGFIIGLNQYSPTDNLAAAAVRGTSRGLNAPEYTSLNAFDAIKAVLDYDPWTITGVYSNVKTNAIQANDDVSLWGVNVGYKFDVYKAEAEGYWFFKKDRSIEKWAPVKGENAVHNLGLRGSLDPMDAITVWGEGAFQVGEFVGSRNQMNARDRLAFALDFGGECRYWTDKFSWKPKLGVEYILYSGDKTLEDNPDQATGDYTGWDPMYRGKFDSAIREFVGRFYTTADYPARNNFLISSADASFTNQHQIVLRGSVQPIESLTISANYNFFWTMYDILYLRQGQINQAPANNVKADGFMGQEVDLQANWDYTEDVSFGLLCGWFIPNSTVYKAADKTATDVVGTVKVSF